MKLSLTAAAVLAQLASGSYLELRWRYSFDPTGFAAALYPRQGWGNVTAVARQFYKRGWLRPLQSPHEIDRAARGRVRSTSANLSEVGYDAYKQWHADAVAVLRWERVNPSNPHVVVVPVLVYGEKDTLVLAQCQGRAPYRDEAPTLYAAHEGGIALRTLGQLYDSEEEAVQAGVRAAELDAQRRHREIGTLVAAYRAKLEREAAEAEDKALRHREAVAAYWARKLEGEPAARVISSPGGRDNAAE